MPNGRSSRRSPGTRGPRRGAIAGGLDLADLAALIAEAPVLIANNSGPVHIAAAVGTPVVDLYGLTNPQHTPWRVRHRVLFRDVPCKFCYKSVCPEAHGDCLRGVAPHEVADAAIALLNVERRGDFPDEGPELAGIAPVRAGVQRRDFSDAGGTGTSTA